MHANYLSTELTALDWDSLAQNYSFPSMDPQGWELEPPSEMIDQHHPRLENPHFHSTPQRSQTHPSTLANGLSQDPMMTAYLMQQLPSTSTNTEASLDLSLGDSQSWSSAMNSTRHPERHQASPDLALEQFYRRYQHPHPHSQHPHSQQHSQQRAMSAPEPPQAHYAQQIRQQQAEQMRRANGHGHPHHALAVDELGRRMAKAGGAVPVSDGEYYRHLGIATAYNQHTQAVHPYFQLQDPPGRTYVRCEGGQEREELELEVGERVESPLGAIKYESPQEVGSLQLE
jgi:hypothetical protein